MNKRREWMDKNLSASGITEMNREAIDILDDLI